MKLKLIISCSCLALVLANQSARAQVATSENIVVTGTESEIPSAYGAPGAFSQSRFAPLTNAYVLPPGEIYTSLNFGMHLPIGTRSR